MAIDTEEVLSPEEEEQRRRQIAGSIGTPAKPVAPPTINRSSLPMIGDASQERPPEMPASSPVTISGTAQIPPYPTPEQSKAAAMEAQGLPQYHGLNRVLDTIGQVIPGGAAVEAASGLGTIGHQVRLNRQEAAAGEEQGREKAAEAGQETQARIGEQEALTTEHGAQTGKLEAETDIARKNAENVTITDSQGHVIGNVPRGKAEDLIKALSQIQGKHEDVKTNADTREDVAEIMVGGKPIETKPIEINGVSHTMGLNPHTGKFDIDMGETGHPPLNPTTATKETDRQADLKSQYGVVQRNINGLASPDVISSFDKLGVAEALYNATAQTVTHAGAFIPGVGAFAIPSGSLDNLVTRGIISAARAQKTVDAYNAAVEGAMQFLLISQGGRVGRGGAALLTPLYNLLPGPRTTNSKQALDQLNRFQDMYDIWKQNHKEYGDAAGPSFRDKPKANKEDLINKYAPKQQQ